MLTCRACFWRSLQALDTSTAPSSRLRRDASLSVFGQQRLSLHTARPNIRKLDVRPASRNKVEKLSGSADEPWRNSPQAVALKKSERGAYKRVAPTELGRDNGLHRPRNIGNRDPSISESDWNRRKRELQHLADPLELANFVKNELKKDKAVEMLQLVKMASHSMQCVVSWNHIIDYHFAKERVSAALKIYNDMKKRAQFPDSYTYTILLRGLSINAHHSGVLSHAISVYHSMSAPNSRVTPSIIHTNAVLRVCARCLDMDALWGFAAKIPATGPSAANAITYITILNATRQNLLVNVPKGETEEEGATRREQGIVEGRRLWEEVIGKWRNADIIIEEELVCAMGRLLLVGSRPRDWDDVLSLVEQTMDIPRLVPRLGTPARHEAGYPHLRAPNVLEQYRYDDDHLTPSEGPARGDEFLALTTKGMGGALSNHLTYARPSNNTLSMVQEACQKVVALKAADEYWEVLTDPTTYGVIPDVNSMHMRLRIFRQNRASASALKLLEEGFIANGMQARAGTFRIAMSTCVRDKNNHNSLKHASQILNIMTTTLEDANPKAVTMYADLVTSFPIAKGADIIDALTLLRPISNNIRLQLGVGGQRKYGNGVGATYLTGADRADAMMALRKIYGVYDRLFRFDAVAEEQKGPFLAERAKLGSFIQRIVYKDTNKIQWEGNWKGAKEALRDDVKPEVEVEVEGGDGDAPKDGESQSRPERGRGGWRTRRAVPAEKRKPWSSSLGATDPA